MALNAAEEENIEAIKKWWEDNGTWILSLVVAGAVVWGGWTFWMNSRDSASAAASDLYEEILALASVEPGVVLSDADRGRVVSLAGQLRDAHGDSAYARYGTLYAAQQLVSSGDLEGAESQLRWVLDNTQGGFLDSIDEGLVLVANLRLGRVLLARGEAEQALALVEGLNPGTFEAEFAELRGDAYVALGRVADARDAYTTAQQAGTGSTFVQMKLDELGN